MTALKYRINEMKADWVIYVVDSGQALHFQQVFAAAREAGWVGDVRLDHVGFGVVQGDDKKKFKTRAGKSVRLIDLLDEARERATAIMKQRVENGASGLSDEKEMEVGNEEMEYDEDSYIITTIQSVSCNYYYYYYHHVIHP